MLEGEVGGGGLYSERLIIEWISLFKGRWVDNWGPYKGRGRGLYRLLRYVSFLVRLLTLMTDWAQVV